MGDLLGVDDLRAAAARLDGRVVRTPTVASPGLSALLGAPVRLKLELLQRTGSFKFRGALHKLLTLDPAQRAAGVVAVSGGNHAVAVAEAAGALGVAATVVMPTSAPARSIAACRSRGAQVRLTRDMSAAFVLLADLIGSGLTAVHPFDDPVVAAAQGTVGLELAEDAPGLTDVLVSIGGGGLIAGVAVAVRALLPGVRVWGVETDGADAMTRALAAGSPVSIVPTSIASTLSAPHVSPWTLAHVRELVEEVLVVSDAEAVGGMVAMAEEAKLWTEPATACVVPAAAEVVRRHGPGTRLGLVVCGGNVSVGQLTGWLSRFAPVPVPAP